MAFLDGPRPRLFAHRGASGTLPENTIEAFAEGLAAGADRLELDVHLSSDGHIVVFHDDWLERTTNGSGALIEHSLAELSALDAGFGFTDASGAHPFRGKGIRIPTLAEVLQEFPGVPLNVEIKQDEGGATIAAFFELLDRHRARDFVLTAAYEDEILARVRSTEPDALTSLSAGEVATFFGCCASGCADGYLPPAKVLQVPPDYDGIELVTPAFVSLAHDLAMEVHVWTINDAAEMERLLDLGIDGLMSDLPVLARATIDRWSGARIAAGTDGLR